MASRNTEPIFIDQPFVGVATLFDQAVNRSASATTGMKLLLTAGNNGALIESLYAVPLGNNADTLLRVYMQPEGSIPILCCPETLLPAINNASATQALIIQTVELPLLIVGDVGSRGLRVPPRASVWAGLSAVVASGYNVIAVGGFY